MKKTTFALPKLKFMAHSKGTEKADERIEVVESALSRSEQFIENNQKPLIIGVLAIALVVVAYFGINRYFIEPKQKEALTQMFMAQKFFESDSLQKALYGDGNSMGFIEIADEYSSTKAGNLACYYAGISLLKKGEFNDAIKYLDKFESNDHILSAMAKGAKGDAYLELNQSDKAASQYMNAAKTNPNEFTSPMFLMKAGNTYELIGNYADALKAYEQLKADFPTTTDGRNADKYIARAQAKTGK
jgi:tetratricopeptide (TPR) repeat protein